MRAMITFGRFWYGFIVGDDWRLAVGAVALIGVTSAAAHRGVNGWWVLPLAVPGVLAVSVLRATRPPGR